MHGVVSVTEYMKRSDIDVCKCVSNGLAVYWVCCMIKDMHCDIGLAHG